MHASERSENLRSELCKTLYIESAKMPRAKKWFLVYEDAEISDESARSEGASGDSQRYLLMKSGDCLLKKRSEPLGRIKDVSLCLA